MLLKSGPLLCVLGVQASLLSFYYLVEETVMVIDYSRWDVFESLQVKLDCFKYRFNVLFLEKEADILITFKRNFIKFSFHKKL